MTPSIESTTRTTMKDSPKAKAANIMRNSVDIYVGSRLRVKRTQSQLTERELSEKLRIDPNDVHAYEGGAKRISAKLLLRIAKLLNVRPSYFFGGYTAGELNGLNFKSSNANPTTNVDDAFILSQAFDGIENVALRQAIATIMIEAAKVRSAEQSEQEAATRVNLTMDFSVIYLQPSHA
jgi:transcriptional regulator with XRE-family HTH domain